jgi:hypothetical protein
MDRGGLLVFCLALGACSGSVLGLPSPAPEVEAGASEDASSDQAPPSDHASAAEPSAIAADAPDVSADASDATADAADAPDVSADASDATADAADRSDSPMDAPDSAARLDGAADAAADAGADAERPVHVSIAPLPDGGSALLRGGAPLYIKGVGGRQNLDLAVKLGANSVRTWGVDDAIMTEASRVGMTVMLGIWLDQTASNYTASYKLDQQTLIQQALDQYKNSPALLMWVLGNELNAGADTPEVWSFVESLAKTLHQQDPHHPVATVLASSPVDTINRIVDLAPSIDVLGVNAYAGIVAVDSMVKQSRFLGPYLVTEWGPNGNWEAPRTTWGSAIEANSTDRAALYQTRYEYIDTLRDRCVGSYVFYWGSTSDTWLTWFNMFAETDADLGLSGESYPSVDVMAYEWSGGTWPANRAPAVQGLTVNGLAAQSSVVVAPSSPLSASVLATDPDGDTLGYAWEIVSEPASWSPSRPTRAGLPEKSAIPTRTITAPAVVGAYRLYVYVVDGKGHAGTANLPFSVQ